MRISDISGSYALAVLCLLAAVPGCSGPGESPPTPPIEDAVPAAGGSLIVGVPGDVSVLDPIVARSNHEMEVLGLLFPYLVEYDFDGKCVPRPGIAERWTVAEDGQSLTFHLRRDALWSDGESIDADDVIFTLDLVGDPEVGSQHGSMVSGLRAEDPVERVDDHTVTVHMSQPRDPATLLYQLTSFPLVPEHALWEVPRSELRAASNEGEIVSSGLFTLGGRTRGQQLELMRSEAPPRGDKAMLDRVVLKVIPEYSTRLIELQHGGIDMMRGIDVEDVRRLQRDAPQITIHRQELRSTDYIAWNLNDPRFADVRVRRALAHAVDVDALMNTLLRAGDEVYGQRAVGTITPALRDFRNPDLRPIPHDLERTRELFAEAGWTDTDGDGYLDRDGERFRFTLLTSANNPRRTLAQTIVQEQLRTAGVDVSTEVIEGNAFFQKLSQRDFEAALVGWAAQLFVDPTPLWHSGDSPFNVSSYANPRADELIERGLATVDPDEAATCWRELQALIHAEQPCCFLYWCDELVGLNGRFRDVTIDTLSPFGRMERWWKVQP